MSGRDLTLAERLDPEHVYARYNSQKVKRPSPRNPIRPYEGDEEPSEASRAAHRRQIEESAAREELLRRTGFIKGDQSDG